MKNYHPSFRKDQQAAGESAAGVLTGAETKNGRGTLGNLIWR